MEKTETVAAKGGRSALRAVDFEVLTAVGIICHECLLPLPGWSNGIIGLGGIFELVSELQSVAGKILKRQGFKVAKVQGCKDLEGCQR